jgi:AcrR family transcriptional regulator
MSQGLRDSAPRRDRRSNAERAAETRARIVAAVVESIAELGFQRTTAAEIARRAGVTWGAVQHHFGGKEGILVAVLEDSFNRFAERFADIDVEGMSLEKRVSLFVDRAWAHFASPHFRSTLEILLHYAAPDPEDVWPDELLAAWNRIWSGLFHDAHLSRGRLLRLQRYTIALLVGLASLEVFERAPNPLRNGELGLLKDTLTRELSRR